MSAFSSVFGSSVFGFAAALSGFSDYSWGNLDTLFLNLDPTLRYRRAVPYVSFASFGITANSRLRLQLLHVVPGHGHLARQFALEFDLRAGGVEQLSRQPVTVLQGQLFLDIRLLLCLRRHRLLGGLRESGHSRDEHNRRGVAALRCVRPKIGRRPSESRAAMSMEVSSQTCE